MNGHKELLLLLSCEMVPGPVYKRHRGIFNEWLWSQDPRGQEAPFNSVLLSQCNPHTPESIQQMEQAGKSLSYECWHNF